MTRILIIGASGFIGGALYRELCHYYDTYGTYHTGRIYSDNQHFFHFDMEKDNILSVLRSLKPRVVISAVHGNTEAQLTTHRILRDYALLHKTRVIYISSANVFDAFINYPSYEYDKTLSESPYGKMKIRMENLFMKLPEKQYIIARLPMVFGRHSPRIRELRYHLQNHLPYEVFPNLVMNVTNSDMVCRQLHYMINRRRKGIFHLGSSDLVHHDEFITECCEQLGFEDPFYKQVYTSNFDRYLAVLPKQNKLPKHLLFSHRQIIEELNPQ